MNRVLVTATNYSRYCKKAKALLESNQLEVVENSFGRPMTFEELREIAGTVDAVIAGVDRWDERVFAIAPRLRIIARFGVGVDNIDTARAKERGILVTNASGANAGSVADLTVAFMLCSLRNLPNLDASVRLGKWDRFMGRELSARRVGLLGFGAIAQQVAARLSAFGCELYAYDPFPNRDRAHALGVRLLASSEEILTRCDVVSLHLPVTPDTVRCIGEKQLRLLQDGAVLINTARGALIDEPALYRELKTGRIRAAVDVYEEEPAKSENPLFRLPNLICTPHTAGETFEAYERIGMTTAQAVVDVQNGVTPSHILNP